MASISGYTTEQLQKLEQLFVECKFPSKEQRETWSEDLGMNPDKIECWFKNKILLQEIEEKNQENNALSTENTRLELENLVMIHELENGPKCHACSRNEALNDLLRENARLREEHKKFTRILGRVLQYPPLLRDLPGEGRPTKKPQ